METAESLGGKVWNLKLDHQGLATWTEPAAASREIEPILALIGR